MYYMPTKPDVIAPKVNAEDLAEREELEKRDVIISVRLRRGDADLLRSRGKRVKMGISKYARAILEAWVDEEVFRIEAEGDMFSPSSRR